MTTRTSSSTPSTRIPVLGRGDALVTKAQARAVTQDTVKGIEKLLAESRKFDAKKTNHEGAASDFKITNAGKMQYRNVTKLKGVEVVDASKPLGFTDNGMSQYLARLSKTYFNDGSSKTMRREDWTTMRERFPKHFAAIMNDVMGQHSKGDNRNLLVRTYAGNVRAVFTDLYGMVDNTDMLEALHTTLSAAADKLPEMRLVRSNVTPDDLLVQVIWKNPTHTDPNTGKKDNNYGVGVAIRNGETGGSGVKVLPMVWRHSCTNSIFVEDDRALNLRHVGQRNALMATIRVAMTQMLPIAADALEKIYAAELEALPDLADVINGFAAEYKWTDEVTDAVKLGTEGKATKMGVINGITYAAHAVDPKNMDLMVDLSTLGGHLLNQHIRVFEAAGKRGAKR